MATEYLSQIGFVFNKAETHIRCDKNKRYAKNKCQECCYYNKFYNQASCNKCSSSELYKICIFKLSKKDFCLSTLAISTTFDEAWESFKNNILYLVNGNFVISVTKCNKLHSFYANLIKIKTCKCCDVVSLYFKYNIIPRLDCYQPVTNTSLCYNQDNQNCENNQYNQNCQNIYNQYNCGLNNINTGTVYNNEITNLNNLQPGCLPPNYWPLGRCDTFDMFKKVCANIFSNISYDLKSGEYDNVKFYYNELYSYCPTKCNIIC